MKKILITLLLLYTTHTYSQSPLPPVYEIKTDTALSVLLPDKYAQMLDDKTGSLTFDQVIGPSIGKGFHYAAMGKLGIQDIMGHTFWFRYVLKNTMGHDAKICLPSNSDESVFYVRTRSGNWQHFENGFRTPWSREAGFKWLQVVPIVIKPGEEVTVVNRVYNYWIYPTDYSNFLSFGSTERTVQQFVSNETTLTDYITFTHDSILFGILFFGAVINLFFFLVVRERVFLYFSLYLVMIGIGRMYLESYFIFFREYRLLWLFLTMFAWHFNWVVLVIFTRSLLHTKAYLPKWDKVLVVIAVSRFVVAVFDCLPVSVLYFTFINNLNTVDLVIIIIAILITFFLSINKNTERSLKLLILPAFVLWGLCNIITILHRFIGYTLISERLSIWVDKAWYTIETVSLTWLAIALSWILLQRFRRLQKQMIQHALDREREKNQLIAEQKVELEKTVKERTEEVLQQKEEIGAQRDNLELALNELKTTQSQLIQREKMASLGELTAGIAHEIQNPLNFVNNFSEVNREMLAELQLELDKGDIKEAKAIAAGLEQNEQKISHHGKRADFIVKGMLEHSRKSTGEKQPTNMNVLCDEFLKLSYHGLRAKDKSFNAEMVTHFAPDLSKINVSQQDMGRVMLNLFNNAFYAVHQKAKTAGADYKPTIEVTTKVSDDKVIISVRDNGPGIPENIKDKIMQPFFTTKPTGEGTGLGLSLSYDIVVKGHNGNIEMDTKEREYTIFTIKLPIS